MHTRKNVWLALLLFVVGACGPKGPGATVRGTEPRRAAAPSTKDADNAEPAAAASAERAPSLGEQVTPAIGAGEYARAEQILEQAASDPGQAAMVAYYRSTLRAFQGDFEAAEAALQEYLASDATPADDPMRPMFHNSLMMLREADGDIAGALVEFHEMSRVAAAGTWNEGMAQMFRLKEIWHRAYLYRIAAESADGAAKAALLRYAEAARAEYTRTATPLEGYGDSIAVLDAYFALRDGNAAAALAAARRVDVEENGDLEDLYLTSIALEFGGDAVAAAAARQRIDEPDAVYLAAPIIRSWVAQDTAGDTRRERWTPRDLRR